MATLSLSFVLNFVINVFVPNHTYADDSISLTISNSNLVLSLAAKTASGEFAESSNATIAVSTTSSNGYTLSIASSTGSTDLTNTKDDSSKITSISNTLTNTDFSNPANTQYNNKWGYKPSQYVVVDGDTHTTIANTGDNAVFKPLPNTSGEILAITDQANASNTPDNYTISMGARANNDTLTGSYVSAPFVITAVANSSVLPCDSSKLCVEYDGNGLNFDGELINRVNYNSSTTQQEITKYSHTSNISDAGVKSGSYPGNLATKDIISIPGASELNVTITYGTENNWDMLYVFQGEYTGTIDRNMEQASTGWLYKYMGGNNTTTTVTITVPDDTATFGFYSDGAGNYYGYYAVITGTGTVLDRTASSGEYVTPTGTNAIFHGWSSTRTTAGAGLPSEVEYADESEVKSKMPGYNGEKKVLYAVWQQRQQITFTKDANVSSIDVLNSDGTKAGTITTSGQSLVLAQGSIYTIKPTYTAGYTTNAITKASGEGTISGDVRERQFTVGAGSATINITSRQMLPMQNYSCSNLANVGDTDMVYDTRDDQAYLIGKLKDGKCWMLENLALDLTNDTILNSLSADNTNIDTTNDPGALAALKGTSVRDSSSDANGKYATAKVSNWTTSYSYSAPLVNLTNKDIVPTDSISTAGGYKVGGYYNYCAASAGSYCYGNGTSEGTNSGNATSDICPKGWRMPTGNTSGEYSALANVIYGSTGSTSDSTAYANYRSALRLPLSGGFGSGSASGQGWSSLFWSSTRYYNNSMYVLNLDTSSVSPAPGNNCVSGNSVRCVLGS